MRVFAVSGFSGTGKTSLVESIVRELTAQGYSVSTLKSSQHEAGDGRVPDTLRHLQAGAITSYFKGPSLRNRTIKELVIDSEDFLIIEGMKASKLPKLWCIGDSALEDTIPTGVVAIISWHPEDVEDKYGIPILRPDDIEQIVSIILKNAVVLDEVKE